MSAPRRAVYRNVNGFSSAVPETAHDGHPVVVLRQLGQDEADLEVGPMFHVECQTDRTTFTAFADELRDE
jgi:hypothetical protein